MLLLVLLELVALETRVDKESYFVYEPVSVEVVVRYDAEKFRSQGVQLFPRELDLPVRIEAEWLDGIEGTILRPPQPGGLTFALNDEIVAGERADGALVIRRTYLPTSPGELIFPAPVLRCATATEFRDDFIHGRMPVDRTDITVEGTERRVLVLPLPAEGRPERFGGAVGRFQVEVESDPGTLDLNEIFKLVLRIEGEGNLAHFDTPRLALAGFHVYGSVDDRGERRRSITYDVAPAELGVTQVPPIEFGYFDPAAGEYRSSTTEPIPVRVVGATARVEESFWPWYLAGALALFAAGLLMLRRRREPDAIEKAAAQFHAGKTFEEFLASMLDCPAAAVISPDLADRLCAAGVPGDLAARAAGLVEKRVGARYGGAEPGEPERAEARALVDAINAAPRAGSGS
ncbi:MAG: BatD family protein [Planctomycetota bacterium]